MNSKKFYALAFGFLLSLGALFAQNPTDSIPQNPADTIRVGKTLYENSCVRCHKLNTPNEYTSQEWPVIVNRMQPKARITDQQKTIILRYLLADAKK